MKRFMNLAAIAALIFSLTLLFVYTPDNAYAQKKGKAEKGYVDENGDGVNDNAKDDDGDGIPNGKDRDYVPPKDGSRNQFGAGNKGGQGMGNGLKGNKFQNKAQNKVANQNRNEVQNRVKGFVDENGDGINDNAKDTDGDGIPNGQDPDYERQNPMKGKGRMGFIDEDGDGINDLALDDDGDGIPNCQDPDYARPQDGNGQKFGQGRGSMSGNLGGTTGDCDGTGPKGKTGRRGGRR